MATYYVNSAADAGGDGTTTALTGAHCAFKTVAQVNAASFSAGDSVLFNKGDTWREQLTVPNSGSAGNPITFGAYGTGAAPIINGADLITTWTDNAPVLGASGSDLLSDNFNDNDISDWDAPSGDVTVGSGIITVTMTGGGADRIRKSITSSTEVWASCKIRLNSGHVGWDNGEGWRGTGPTLMATYANNLFVGMVKSGGVIYWLGRYATDGSTGIDGGTSAVEVTEDVWHTVLYYWKAATGPGANDGIGRIWVDDTLIFEKTDIDSDTLTVTGFHLGNNNASTFDANFNVDDVAVGTTGTAPVAGKADTWKATCTVEPYHVFFNGEKGTKETSVANLSVVKEWFWSGNILYVYSTTDPDSAYTSPGIESGTRRYCIYASAKDYITIDGIDVCKAGAVSEYSENIELTGCDYYNIKNLSTTYAWDCGINILGETHHGTVDNVTATYCGWTTYGVGIYLYSLNATYHVFENCLAHNNNGSGICMHGIETAYGGPGGPDYCEINNNQSYSNGRRGISLTMATNCRVEGNTVYSNGLVVSASGEGIKFSSGDEPSIYNSNNVVTRNMVYSNQLGGIVTYMEEDFEISNNITYGDNAESGIRVSSYDGGLIYNNTCYNNEKYGIELQNGTGDPVIIKNNIIQSSNARTAGIYVYANATGNFTTDYNQMYDLTYWITGYPVDGDNESLTLAEFQAATANDDHSAITDPLIIDAAGGDFRLNTGSPCIKTGTDLSLSTDFFGNGWRATPSMGAIEYSKIGGVISPRTINRQHYKAMP